MKVAYLLLVILVAGGFVILIAFFSAVSDVRTPIEVDENSMAMISDRDYFPNVANALESANSSVHIIIYSANYYLDYPNSSTNILFDELERLSDEGKDVRMIVDEDATDAPVVRMMKERGINIKFDSSATTTHAKLIIIDSKIIIIGSTNWSYNSIEKNHETNVMINSVSLAKQYEGYFERVWSES
jgi:phosphatidylserine/phosphatidylglycerophosphate/cardiolipin synthase-like enzyme